MSDKPKVFLVTKGEHDYSQAAIFGEVTQLTKSFIGRFHITKMIRSFQDALEDSTPEDYIVVGGPSTMLAAACAVFAHKHGRLNLLIWQPDDEMGGRYICRKTVL